jgi:hypothetical protein
MRRTAAFRACFAAALACAAFVYCGSASALDGHGKVGMNARAFLAECEKGVEFWCSNQIYGVDIDDSLRHMAKSEPKTHCLPPKGDGTSAERNAKIVAAVKGWFEQHPEEVASKGDAAGPIAKAMDQLWPGACSR